MRVWTRLPVPEWHWSNTVCPQATFKRYQTEHKMKQDSLERSQSDLKKLRRKSQGKNASKYESKENEVRFYSTYMQYLFTHTFVFIFQIHRQALLTKNSYTISNKPWEAFRFRDVHIFFVYFTNGVKQNMNTKQNHWSINKLIKLYYMIEEFLLWFLSPLCTVDCLWLIEDNFIDALIRAARYIVSGGAQYWIFADIFQLILSDCQYRYSFFSPPLFGNNTKSFLCRNYKGTLLLAIKGAWAPLPNPTPPCTRHRWSAKKIYTFAKMLQKMRMQQI